MPEWTCVLGRKKVRYDYIRFCVLVCSLHFCIHCQLSLHLRKTNKLGLCSFSFILREWFALFIFNTDFYLAIYNLWPTTLGKAIIKASTRNRTSIYPMIEVQEAQRLILKTIDGVSLEPVKVTAYGKLLLWTI